MKLVQKCGRGETLARAEELVTRIVKSLPVKPTFSETQDAIWGLEKLIRHAGGYIGKRGFSSENEFLEDFIVGHMNTRPWKQDKIDTMWNERTQQAPIIFFKEHPELLDNTRINNILRDPWIVNPKPVYEKLYPKRIIGRADTEGGIYYSMQHPFDPSAAIHEDHHAWRALIQKEVNEDPSVQWFAGDEGSGYDQREELLLKKAYPMSTNFIQDNGILYPIGERGAVNAQVRHYLSTNSIDPFKLDVKPLNEVFLEALKDGKSYGKEIKEQLGIQKEADMSGGLTEEKALKKQNSNILGAITRVGGIAIPALYVVDKKVPVKRFGGNIQKAQGGGPLARKSIEIAQKLKRTYGPLGWRTAWYNNITPGSYSANLSWHPKGKILGEVPNALVDYVLGKGRKEAPKWEYTMGKDDKPLYFNLRKEAFKIYQGIPHKEHYIINTGKKDLKGTPVYHLNLKEFPDENIFNFLATMSDVPVSHKVSYDPAFYGGDINVVKKTDGNIFHIKLDDVWDVNPFKEPGRIAESLPAPLRKLLFRQILNPKGSEYKYSYEFQPWSKGIKTFEMGNITGGKPFRSTTTIKGRLLPVDTYYKRKSPDQYLEEVDKWINEEARKEWPELFNSPNTGVWKKIQNNIIESIRAKWERKPYEEKLKLVPIDTRVDNSELKSQLGEYHYPEFLWEPENKK